MASEVVWDVTPPPIKSSGRAPEDYEDDGEEDDGERFLVWRMVPGQCISNPVVHTADVLHH